MEPAPVYVGVLLVRLATPWARSLKEKRSLVKPVSEGLKSRFPVSVARLAGVDDHDWELLGVSALSADRVWLEGMLNKCLDFIRSREVEVAAFQLDIDRWDHEI